MVTALKKATPPVPAAAPVPATAAPEAPARTQAALAVPAKLPARQRVAVKKSALTPLEVTPAVQPKMPAQPALTPAEKTAAPEKLKKSKRVRDSFSMPKAEYAVLDGLKQRAALLECPAKRSELVRAGIGLLAAMSDTQFLAALAQVPDLRPGRKVADQ